MQKYIDIFAGTFGFWLFGYAISANTSESVLGEEQDYIFWFFRVSQSVSGESWGKEGGREGEGWFRQSVSQSVSQWGELGEGRKEGGGGMVPSECE